MRCKDWQVASLDRLGSRARELRLPELSLGLAMTYAVFDPNLFLLFSPVLNASPSDFVFILS